MLYVSYIVFSVSIIIFGGAMMLVSRQDKRSQKPSIGVGFSGVLTGLAILLREYGLIPSIAGWALIGTAILLFWVSFYEMFFRHNKIDEPSNPPKSWE
jgi:hypothetical protein